MDQLPWFLVALGIAVVFGFLAYRAWRARNGVVKWVGTVGSGLIVLGAVILGAQSLVALIQYNLPAMNPPLTSSVHGTYLVGNFVLAFSESGQPPALRVTNTAEPQRVLWENIPNVAFVSAAQDDATIHEFGAPEGLFSVDDKILADCTNQSIDSVEPNNGALIVHGTLSGSNCTVNYRLTFTPISDNQLQFQLQTEGAAAGNMNRLVLRYASSADEHIFGLGEQLTYFDQKGKIVPMVVQEHGLARGIPILTQIINLLQDNGAGNPVASGVPVPQYITSKLRSLFLENKEYGVFDLHHADRVEITLLAKQMTGRILYGKTPMDLIQEFTEYAGRMRALPDWIQEGAILGVQGGTDAVLQKLDVVEKAGAPISAVWMQDWEGKRVTPVGSQLWWQWKLDETFYHDWDAFVAGLKQKNIRVMIYINPFLTNIPGHDEQYQEALKNGYLVEHQDGTPYLIKNSDFYVGMVDFSNPNAREWMKGIIKNELITHGQASGWMADFAEALPYDAKLYNNADPMYWHNHYPEAWAEINREAIKEAGRENDIVFFERSGFTQSPTNATLFWLGDQEQTWDEYDGIKTAVTGMLTGGVSGLSLIHGDTGGFDALQVKVLGKNIPIVARTKEMSERWTELETFTSVLRTHEGLIPEISAQVYDDADSAAQFARMAKVYQALAFYRKQLVQEAADTGHPVVRHPFLEFPHDPNTLDLKYQYMFGSEFMFAPVLDPGVTKVRVYLPAGSWTQLWTGEVKDSANGQWVETDAPLGKPAVFYKTGSAVGAQFVAALKEAVVY